MGLWPCLIAEEGSSLARSLCLVARCSNQKGTRRSYGCADLASDGSVLVVGLPDSGVGGRSVRVFTADPSGTYIERLNITAPTNGPGGSRFGAQVTCATAQDFLLPCILSQGILSEPMALSKRSLCVPRSSSARCIEDQR